jgi:exopolyphosphatase/guanosine-5'-triphosphate,3'-diphosphate pyrophosphatase
MRVAALDLGSNTTLLLIAEVNGGKIGRVLHDETTVTRMGQGVHADRRFHPEALARVEESLASYRQTIDQFHVERVVAVATSAARDVANAGDLLAIGNRHKIPIQIISGRDEAQLTFQGALSERANREHLAVVDVGGGSTEIIAQNAGIVKGFSVDVGSVRLTELFVRQDPIATQELSELQAYARQAFAAAPLPDHPIRELIAVAGTPTTLAALDQSIDFSEEQINGYTMSLTQIDRWTDRLAQLDVRARSALRGMQPKRADVIVSGATILSCAIRAVQKQEVTVSTRGVRFGVALAWERF